MAAAGMAGLLLTHHAFHRPLDFGWLAAAVFALVLVAMGVYAFVPRDRVSFLRNRVSALERKVGQRKETLRRTDPGVEP